MKEIEQIIEMTGLPSKMVFKELSRLAESNGKNMDILTIEELREILVEYLQDVILDAKKRYR